MDIILYGAIASLAAGLMTGVGALPVLVGRTIPQHVADALLGFAAGVMLAASFFSLLVPSLEASERIYGGVFVPAAIAAAGFLIGVAAIAAVNEWLPHEHFRQGREGGSPEQARQMARIWLFVLAIAIHNFPEGLAVGVGFGGGDFSNGIALATGIGLQNAPEGLAVALALAGLGYARGYAFLIALLTGLIEPVGGLLGVAAVTVSQPFLPWGLAFAAGAMLYVISHEIIPETHRRGHQNAATAGLSVGLALMMFLDVTLG